MRIATAGKNGVVLFQRRARGRKHRICFGACFSLFVSRTGAGEGCLFLLGPRAPDLKPIKIYKIQEQEQEQERPSHSIHCHAAQLFCCPVLVIRWCRTKLTSLSSTRMRDGAYELLECLFPERLKESGRPCVRRLSTPVLSRLPLSFLRGSSFA